MKQVTSAEFRTGFAMYLEPVEVRRYTNIIGTWYPQGTESPVEEVPITTEMLATYRTEIDAQAEEIKQLKRLLAASSRPGPTITLRDEPGFGHSNPVPKPVSKKK